MVAGAGRVSGARIAHVIMLDDVVRCVCFSVLSIARCYLCTE